MEDLKSQVKDLIDRWENIKGNILDNPGVLQAHLPNISLDQLDEVVNTISIWIDRSRAPSGYSPGYHLAKAMTATHIPTLLTITKNLEAGQYNHLQGYVNTLANLFPAQYY